MAHGTSRTQHDPWLVLCEASGEPVLSIPPYGLDDYDVRKFAAAAGWDLDLAGTQLDGWDKGPTGWDVTFPHWYDKPRSWANGRWVESRWAKLKQRFSGRGRFGCRGDREARSDVSSSGFGIGARISRRLLQTNKAPQP